jgi:TPR repeat protein
MYGEVSAIMLQSGMKKLNYLFIVLSSASLLLYGGEMTQRSFEATLKKCEAEDNGAACAKLYYYFISSKRAYLSDLQGDKQKALHYAKKACVLNDRDGCLTAGMTLYYGDRHAGITAEREKGRGLLKKACELGQDDVCTFFLNPNF